MQQTQRDGDTGLETHDLLHEDMHALIISSSRGEKKIPFAGDEAAPMEDADLVLSRVKLTKIEVGYDCSVTSGEQGHDISPHRIMQQ